MISIYYCAIFAASLVCSGIYIFIWHKHFDVNFDMIFTLIPVSCAGNLLLEMARTKEGAIRAVQITYIGGSFLQLFIFFSILNLCQITCRKGIRTALFFLSAGLFASTLTIGYSDVFYKKIYYERVWPAPVLVKEYGPMHTVFIVYIFALFLAGIVAIIYSWHKKKQVPRTVIYLLVIPDTICVLGYYVGRRIVASVDLLPLGYVIAEVFYLLIAYRVNLYDVGDTVIDSMVREQGLGYISFDFNYRYLGSNEAGKVLVPELRDLAVDEVFGYKPAERKVRHFLDNFSQNPENNRFVYTVPGIGENAEDERIYNANVNYLYDDNRRRGYIVTFADDTQNRKYIQLLDTYNESLQEEVEAKTRSIIEMHDNLIMSLAMMVESRDNSTGGHIKRTSEGVRILIDEILEEGNLPLSPEFCEDVVKAAPMHDLGKIAVDDAVLRKPGRFTPEEFEMMKHHAAEGGRIIHEILLHTDDESFKTVAENVAHYHHERWDGSGYPEKLSGTDIPIEARIMAIADVYDALVSKRVYKEAFDFEKANSIIMDGMGTQFDPGLKSVYEHARPKLEAYYQSL